MTDSRYTHVAAADVELRERRGGGAGSQDLSAALAAEQMKVRIWQYGPGHAMAYHRHASQEEIYHLIAGGPQEIEIDGAVVVVQDLDWLRLPKDTPRRIRNTTDRMATWLTIAAPPGEGIMDGIRLDPETGEVIPRA